MLQLNSQTQTLSSMCAEPSARSHTPQHNVQLTSEFTCAHETTVNSQTPFAGHFRFSLFFAAPAFSSSRAQMHKTKSTLWPRDEREPSAVHTVSKCASSSVKYRTMFRRLLEEDEAKCKGSRRPGHRRTRGRAGGCVHADIATSCCSSRHRAPAEADHTGVLREKLKVVMRRRVKEK